MKTNFKTNEVRYYLKNNSKGKATIFALFNFGYKEDGHFKPLQITTGEQIDAKFWDKKNHCIIKDPSIDWRNINQNLKRIGVDIIDSYEKLIVEKQEITPESIKKGMGVCSPTKLPEKITVIGFIESYLKTCNKDWKTIRHYNTTLNHLKKYSKLRRKKINFTDIDKVFYLDFIKYLEGCNHRINTIGGHIKNLKVFLRASFQLKLHNNNYFMDKEFRIIQEDIDCIYLDQNELRRIYQIDLSKHPTLAQTRDAFIIASLTGLRFSDIENLKPEDIGNDRIIRITSIKTKKDVCLPIGSILQAILDKYSPKLPKVISNQKFNDNLKIIAKLAKLNTWEKIVRSNGGKRVTKLILKYWLVSSHTARRSFATNLALSGTPIASIMAITGHKTEKSFWKYVRTRPPQNATSLLNHPYLNF